MHVKRGNTALPVTLKFCDVAKFDYVEEKHNTF